VETDDSAPRRAHRRCDERAIERRGSPWRFREDLYYGQPLTITLPVSDRPADVQSLAEYLMRNIRAESAQDRTNPRDGDGLLAAQQFPGNAGSEM